jgi:class 3 adenylate cyclase
MELPADRDPEEARKLLDPVLDRLMEAVHRYEGTVNQVMGDGIMALFGAPARPRGPRRAGLLCGAGHAGAREDVRGGASTLRGTRCPSRSGSASTRDRSSCVPSAATSVWTTPRWARPPTWPPAWEDSRPEWILVTAECLRLAEG